MEGVGLSAKETDFLYSSKVKTQQKENQEKTKRKEVLCESEKAGTQRCCHGL
jgi:hypothetical protein